MCHCHRHWSSSSFLDPDASLLEQLGYLQGSDFGFQVLSSTAAVFDFVTHVLEAGTVVQSKVRIRVLFVLVGDGVVQVYYLRRHSVQALTELQLFLTYVCHLMLLFRINCLKHHGTHSQEMCIHLGTNSGDIPRTWY